MLGQFIAIWERCLAHGLTEKLTNDRQRLGLIPHRQTTCSKWAFLEECSYKTLSLHLQKTVFSCPRHLRIFTQCLKLPAEFCSKGILQCWRQNKRQLSTVCTMLGQPGSRMPCQLTSHIRREKEKEDNLDSEIIITHILFVFNQFCIVANVWISYFTCIPVTVTANLHSNVKSNLDIKCLLTSYLRPWLPPGPSAIEDFSPIVTNSGYVFPVRSSCGSSPSF